MILPYISISAYAENYIVGNDGTAVGSTAVIANIEIPEENEEEKMESNVQTGDDTQFLSHLLPMLLSFLIIMFIFNVKKVGHFMKKRRLTKRICAIMLAISMILPGTLLCSQTVEAGTFTNNVKVRLCTDLFNICSRTLCKGLGRATQSISDDSIYQYVSTIIFGSTKNANAELREELLNSIAEVDSNVTSTRNYLAGLIENFKSNVNMQNLSSYTTDMNMITSEVQIAWNEYYDYIKALKAYGNYPTESNQSVVQTTSDLLFQDLAKMDFSKQMTEYISYVSTKLAHFDGEGMNNSSKTYLYWVYQFCQDEYAFDHQRYEVLCNAISMNVGDIEQMMELHAIYVEKIKADYENGTSSLTSDEINVIVKEYNNCMNMGLNACNNIAEQYADEMQKMLRRYDVDTTYALDYKSAAYENDSFILTADIQSDVERTFKYYTESSKTNSSMDFYRVGVNGKTYLFLKQKDVELSAADLLQKFSLPKEDVNLTTLKDPELAMKSMDWINLETTKDGNYKCITSVDPIYQMLSTSLYNNCGNDFLKYLQLGGGLTEVAGTENPTPYLFLNSTKKAEISRLDAVFSSSPQIYVTANWAELAKMSLTAGKFDSSCDAASKEYANVTDKNVLVMMEESENAVFDYSVTQKISGSGSMSVVVDNIPVANEEHVLAGKQLSIRVKPNEFQTLKSLTIKGIKKENGDSLDITLATDDDYNYMQIDEDGYATYSFIMPYQDCTITANFVKDTTRNAHTIKTEITGKGQYRILDQEDEAVITYGNSNKKGIGIFGETLELTMIPEDNWYVKSVKVTTDTEDKKDRVTLLTLSTLEETHFVMPDQNCILEIEFAEMQEVGTIDDPYLISSYEQLVYYANCMMSGNSQKGYDKEHYRTAHYRVTQDLNCDASISTPFGGMWLDENGTFDGQGYKISNLASACGLFYNISKNAVVKNIALSNVQKCYGNQGVTLAYTNAGTIDACTVEDTKFSLMYNAGKGEIGGLVYQNTATGIIRNSGVMSDCKISGQYVGGLTYTNDGAIQNCYFSGEIILPNVSEACAGGISRNGSGTIDCCYNSGNLNSEAYQGNVAECGAVIAVEGDQTVTNCYYNTDSAGYKEPVNSTITGKDSVAMRSDDFVVLLNQNKADTYKSWTRSDDVNSGYPTFERNKWYYLTEKVIGSGAVISSRENGGVVSLGIAAGETIQLQVIRPENVELVSLKVCSASDKSVVYKNWNNTAEERLSFQMPNDNSIIIAEFTNLATEYTISNVVDGVGEIAITDESGKDVTASSTGKTIHVKAIPGIGYSLDTFELRKEDGTTLQTFSKSDSSFAMGNQQYVVYAKFIPNEITCTLTTSIVGEGAVQLTSAEGVLLSEQVKPHTTVKVSATPENGWYPSSIQLIDTKEEIIDTIMSGYEQYESIKNQDGSYVTSFSMPSQDCKIIVTYAQIPVLYNVSIDTIGSGISQVNKLSGIYTKGRVTSNTELEILAYPDNNATEVKVNVYDKSGTQLAMLSFDDSYVAKTNESRFTYAIPEMDVRIQVQFGNDATSDYTPLNPNKEGKYEISSYSDLITMSKMVNDKSRKYASATFVQTQNINCQKQEWNTEIGTMKIPFEGTYDGKNFYILGLRPTKTVSGLFGVIGTQGVVKNLSVVDFDYTEPAESAGGIAGTNYGLIDNCGSGVNFESVTTTFFDASGNPVALSTLNSDIQATSLAGGIVAVNEGIIINSRNSSVITIKDGNKQESCAGGIAAQNTGIISNIYNMGRVSNAAYAGGIVGKNTGSIQYGYAGRIVIGVQAGGIAGQSDNENIKNMFYHSGMSIGVGNYDDAQISTTAMEETNMKTQTFTDTLNQLISETDFMKWSYNANKNEGFPRIKNDEITSDRLLTSVNRGEIDGLNKTPENPNPTTGDKTNTSTNTGDTSNAWIFFILLLLSAGCCTSIIIKKRRHK